MKSLISSLIFTIPIFLEYGELVATGERGTKFFDFDFMSHRIGLWVNTTTGRVTRADFEGNFVPDENYFREHNYLIRLIDAHGLKFIAFISADKSLLGVEARSPERVPYHVPQPNEAIWYIAFEGKYLRLVIDYVNGTPRRLALANRNGRYAGLTPIPVEVADIKFFVFKNDIGVIKAASLLPR